MTGDAPRDLTGRRLGNYRIDGVLGRGGMSVMYRATDVRLGRKVALKVIGEHLGADAEFRERFVDEARNTSAIDHANIVPLYDFGEIDEMLYIAMRLVDGSDLASLIGGAPMEPERVVGLLDQVGDALDTLHARGLVHLDVKPANVLVTSRESVREHVYIADFGLTRRGTTGHRTREGDFLGSPTYAAPEHLRGESLDGRTDQYSLACMLYACLTGGPPFQGDVETVIKGHLSGTPAPASSVVSSLPPELDEVIGIGMAKDPDERYETCVGLMSAARKALPPEPALSPSHPTRPVVAGQQGTRGPGHPHEQQPGSQSGPPGQPDPSGQPPTGHGPQIPPGYGPVPAARQPGPYPPPSHQPAPHGYPAPAGGVSGVPPQMQPGYGQPPTPGYGMAAPPQRYAPPPQVPGPPAGFGQPPPSLPPSQSPRKGGKAWIVWMVVAVLVVCAGVVALLLVTRGDQEPVGDAPPVTEPPASSVPEISLNPPGGIDTGNHPGGGPTASQTRDLPPPTIPVRPAPLHQP